MHASFLAAFTGLAILALAAPLVVASGAPAATAATVDASQTYVVSADAVAQDVVRDAFGARKAPVQEGVRAIAQRALDRIGATGYTLVIDAPWGGSHYGRTDFLTRVISIRSSTPTALIESVALHEYGHVVQSKEAGDDWTRVNDIYGHLAGVEAWADCFALAHGATWVGYGCNGSY